MTATRAQAPLRAVAFEVLCIWCGEPLTTPDTGSYIWDAEIINKTDARQCLECGHESALPAIDNYSATLTTNA